MYGENIVNNKSSKRGELLFYIAMCAPAIILFLMIIAGPILVSLGISLTNYDFRPNQVAEFVGFENFIKLFKDPIFWLAFKNNMAVVAISVFGQIPLGLLLAYFLYRGMVKFQHFFQAMVFFPQVISVVVLGRLFNSFFGVRGAMTDLVRKLTGNNTFVFTWFQTPGEAMIPVLIAMLMVYTGFFMLLFLANMQKLDGGIVEAAAIDGANEFQIFTRIITPALAGIIVVNAILAISGSLRSFGLIYAMAPNDGRGLGENNMVLATYMFYRGFKAYKMAFGSAVSVMIVSISVVFIGIANWIGKKLNPLRED